ncbi:MULTISPECIES: hypothetical protein [unclassified Actinomadura]|uniref:hypothetical protein n=1 Tax=unclassified Actinomadura TaxID=2626254 RepID=UPI0011EBBABE|nr:hypothetical protein [Actinomadura sp. K4S16]
MSTRYENRCRLLLRAYPRHYREIRGAELLGTLLDAAEPGRSTPTLRESWAVIRGGLATRHRVRPPLRHLLAYRLRGKRVPYKYRWWVRDDILSQWASVRLPLLWGVFVLSLMLWDGYSIRRIAIAAMVQTLGIALILWRARRYGPDRSDRELLWKHEFLPDGTPFEASRPQPPAPASGTSPTPE